MLWGYGNELSGFRVEGSWVRAWGAKQDPQTLSTRAHTLWLGVWGYSVSSLNPKPHQTSLNPESNPYLQPLPDACSGHKILEAALHPETLDTNVPLRISLLTCSEL